MATPAPSPKRPTIAGIYELGHVLYTLDVRSHGFAREDIATVERYWTFGDLHSSAAGFVLRLKDGRRAYAELQHTHAYEQVEDFRVDIVPLDGGEDPPQPARPLEPRVWSDETAHLDRVIAG
jgi:hypothetical protein